MSSARLTAFQFRQASGRFATGVAVLATRAANGTPHGLTVNSFASLSLDPPLVVVAVDLAGSLLRVFEHAEHWAVNILREEQRHLSIRFSELPEGRFDGVEWTEGLTGAPLLSGALATLECVRLETRVVGDHLMLIGEAVEASASEGQPLIFFGSEYKNLE